MWCWWRRTNGFKDQFIARLNHEIRNPLNGLIGVARLIESRARDLREEMLAEMLRGCTEQLRAVLDDVLDLSRVDEERVEVLEERFELVELVRNTCRRFDDGMGAVEFLPPEPAPRWCRGDAGKIRLVLGNFLSNARKYGVPPRAGVRLELREQGPSAITVRVSVENRGPTLSAEELATLFSPYQRGQRAEESGAEGTGLGLVFCRRYAEAMGGQVGAESVAGRTTFWLEVPLACVADHEVIPPEERIAANLRVLAIEDERYNRFVLGHYLEELGVEADWATNFSEALILAGAQRHDLILTDWSLPDMAGAEALEKFRAKLGDAMPPVVVVSVHATVAMRQQVMNAGAADFVSKPVTLERLRAALARLHLASRHPFAIDEPPPVAGRLNFARLLLAGPAAEVLPRFTADLRAGLTRARQEAEHDRLAAGARLHALRSLALLVDASSLAALLAELEVLVPAAVALTREQLLFARADDEVAHIIEEAKVLAASTKQNARH